MLLLFAGKNQKQQTIVNMKNKSKLCYIYTSVYCKLRTHCLKWKCQINKSKQKIPMVLRTKQINHIRLFFFFQVNLFSHFVMLMTTVEWLFRLQSTLSKIPLNCNLFSRVHHSWNKFYWRDNFQTKLRFMHNLMNNLVEAEGLQIDQR